MITPEQIVTELRGKTFPVSTRAVLHSADGSDPIMLDMLSLKGDQSRGIIRPGEEAEGHERDGTRIQRLAEAILKGGRNA